MPSVLLDDRGVLRVTGEDARSFLHGLVTQDVQHLAQGEARHAALLSPQGKIIADFFIFDGGNALFLDVRRSILPDLLKRLTFYRLRAKIVFEDMSPDLGVRAFWGGDVSADGHAYADPRHPALGQRAIVARTGETGDPASYHAHRLALGVPEGGADYAFGEVFPHEADMDQLAGIDFRKGCFIGQEVVSRMQHRGTARSRFIPVSIEGEAPGVGAAILAGERSVGVMGSSVGSRGLALLRLDRAEEAMAYGLPLIAGAARVSPSRPDWATFAFPGAPTASA